MKPNQPVGVNRVAEHFEDEDDESHELPEWAEALLSSDDGGDDDDGHDCCDRGDDDEDDDSVILCVEGIARAVFLPGHGRRRSYIAIEVDDDILPDDFCKQGELYPVDFVLKVDMEEGLTEPKEKIRLRRSHFRESNFREVI